MEGQRHSCRRRWSGQPRIRAAAGVLLMMLPMACASVPEPTSKNSQAWAQQVPRLMDEALVPGLQMAIIDKGRVQVLPFGIADVQTGRRVTADTVFEAASLGKPVFAYGVLRLASEDRIDLDGPIGRYLDGLPPDVARLTPRRLLSHSAGLPNSPPRDGVLIPEAAAIPRFSYSGEGIKLLQRVVERITGQGLQDYMQAAVFEPLGMISSSYVWRDDYGNRKAFGHGYTGSSSGRTRVSQAQAPSSLETTVGDYARFLMAATRGRGLRPDIAEQFLRPQIALEQGCVVCAGKIPGQLSDRLHWGLGFGLEKAGDRTFAWHWGDNQTMQSYAVIEADGSQGVVILTNSANGHSIAREIVASVLGFDAPGYAWLGIYAPYTEPARRLLGRIVHQGATAVTEADLTLSRADLRTIAERLIAGGRPADGAELMRRIIASGKSAAEDHALLAEALRKMGSFAEARRAADVGLCLETGNPQAEQVLKRIVQSEKVIPAERLGRFAGLYSSPFGPMEIRSDGRRLTAQLIDQPPSEMLPLTDRSFLIEEMGVPIEFVEEPDGTVSHAIVRADREFKLPRLPTGS